MKKSDEEYIPAGFEEAVKLASHKVLEVPFLDAVEEGTVKLREHGASGRDLFAGEAALMLHCAALVLAPAIARLVHEAKDAQSAVEVVQAAFTTLQTLAMSHATIIQEKMASGELRTP